MSKFYHFPSDFFWTTKIKNHQIIKNNLVHQIENDIKNLEKKPDWCCDVISSFCYKKDFLYDNFLVNNIVWEPIDMMLSSFPNNFWEIKIPINSSISNIWYNYYNGTTSSHQEQHHHRPHSFSGIYFLKLVGKNTTTFYNYHSDINFERRKILDNVEEGDVVIFPSSLMHQVNFFSGEKISISFNLSSIYSSEKKFKNMYSSTELKISEIEKNG